MQDREKESRGLISRLRRIEGQVRGLQRMIEEGQDCEDVITQLSAARSALDRVGFMILSHRMEECLRRRVERGENAEESMQDALKLFLRLA
jgi:DNA-binding FrmR family transcriptional regulator